MTQGIGGKVPITTLRYLYLGILKGEGLELSNARLMDRLGIQTFHAFLIYAILMCLSSSDLLFIFVVLFLPFQDLLDSDWASVRKVLEQADILVIKYSVTDKLAFQQVRNSYAPRLRPLLRHWGVPVILVAVGARLNGEDAFVLCFCYSQSEFSFAFNALTSDGSSNSLSLLFRNNGV